MRMKFSNVATKEEIAARKKRRSGVNSGLPKARVQVSQRDMKLIVRARAESQGLIAFDESSELTAKQMAYLMTLPANQKAHGLILAWPHQAHRVKELGDETQDQKHDEVPRLTLSEAEAQNLVRAATTQGTVPGVRQDDKAQTDASS